MECLTFFESREAGKVLNLIFWHAVSPKEVFSSDSDPMLYTKMEKKGFFPFFQLKIHQNIFYLGGGNKKCAGMIAEHFRMQT